MCVHVLKSALDGIGEFLDYFRIFFQIALFCTVGSIGNISGINAQRGHYRSAAFFFKPCGKWFKFHSVISVVAGECGCG